MEATWVAHSLTARASPILCPPAATLIGCGPNNFVAANAGAHLGELKSLSDLVSYKLVAFMGVVGIIGGCGRAIVWCW